MILYFARHGQVIPSEFQGDELYQRYDRPLTQIGLRQAELLGKRMKSLGFSGPIYSSPFRRTLQTAEIIASETGCTITPLFWLHERFTNQESAEDFRGMTRLQILSRFSFIEPDFSLPEPWFCGKAETLEEVDERIADGMRSILEKEKDCLMIGHGASFAGVRRFFGVEHPKGAQSWNCGLTTFQTDGHETVALTYYDVSHLPEDLITLNGKTKAELIAEGKEIS